MLKKWLDGKIEDVPKNGYLNINSGKHLVLNIQNQPIDVLNANGIYEYVESEKPKIASDEYCTSIYSLCGNVITKVHEVHKIEEVESDGERLED